MRLLRIFIGLGFLSALSAQSVSVTVNIVGNFSYTYNGDNPSAQVTAAGGTVAPFGPATATGAFAINFDEDGNPLTGTFTFTTPNGSFTVSFSTFYPEDATTVTFGATVTGGTGSFAKASGTLQLTATGFITDSNGSFTLTGGGTITGITSTAPTTAFPQPNPPAGPGPEGDPSVVSCATCSQPVTTSNGNMYHQFLDLTLPSRGFPMTLSRTYNSQSGADGMFGIGWTNPYQRWLNPGTSSVVYYNETGGAYTFPAQGSGYASPAGLNMTLSKTAQGYTIQTATGWAMGFDSNGRLTTLADSNGNTQTIAYTSQGRPATVADAIGSFFTFSYDSNNHVTGVQDSAGRKLTYQYDSSGNLISSTDPAAAQTKYAYYAASSGGYLQTITFADGGTISYQYGADHKASQVVDRGGAQTQFTYASNGSQTVMQDELGNSTTFLYNSAGNLTRKTKPDGTSISRTWDGNSRLVSATDESGSISTYQNDAKGNLLSATNPLGGVAQFTYDPVFNKMASFKDAKGNLTQYKYDSKGNLIAISDALGGITSYTYDSYGNILSSTDPTGAAIRMQWDSHNHATAITDALGHATAIAYDAAGRPVSFTDPLHNVSTSAYDSAGRLAKSVDPLGESSSFTYDAVGNLASETDGNGRATAFGVDHLGNLTKVTDASGHVTTYAYSPGACNGCSASGTLSAIVNAAGQTSGFTYNSNGYVATATDAAQNIARFTYDAVGNLSQMVDRNGAATVLTHDAMHRLTRRAYADGSADVFTYDANGNMLTASNQNVTLTFTYDAMNRVTNVADSRFPAATAYAYDRVGRRTSMTDPYGAQTIYQYDAAGHLTGVQGPNGKTTSFAYDAAGRRVRMSMGNGLTAEYRYDAAGELTAVAYFGGGRKGQAGFREPLANVVDQFAYTFDKAGNRLTMASPAGTRSWQYDALYQVTGAASPGAPAESYTYDAAGNRTASGSQAMTYDSAGRLSSFGAAAYTYDKNGNTISRTNAQGATTYTYDGADRLVGVGLPDGSKVTYKYDPLGRRIEKNAAGVTTRYLYDNDNVLLEQAGSAPFSARYTYGPRVDEPLIVESGGASYYYLADGNGNIVDLTNGGGAVIQAYDLDSFGNLRSSTGTSAAIQNPYLFAGRTFDSETGLYYFRARYYDPATGRFLTQDPASPTSLLTAAQSGNAAARLLLGMNQRMPLSLNLYAYAANNPVNHRDPFGLDDLGDNFSSGPASTPDAGSGNAGASISDIQNGIASIFTASSNLQTALNSASQPASSPSAGGCTNPGANNPALTALAGVGSQQQQINQQTQQAAANQDSQQMLQTLQAQGLLNLEVQALSKEIQTQAQTMNAIVQNMGKNGS